MKIFSTIKLDDRTFYLTDEQSNYFLKESVFAKSSKSTGISKFIKYYNPYKNVDGDDVQRFSPTTQPEYYPSGYEVDENGVYVRYIGAEGTIEYFNPWYPRDARRVVENTYLELNSTIRISNVSYITGIAVGDYVILNETTSLYVKADPVTKYTKSVSYQVDTNGDYIYDDATSSFINPFENDKNWYTRTQAESFSLTSIEPTEIAYADEWKYWVYDSTVLNNHNGYYLPYCNKFDETTYLTRYNGDSKDAEGKTIYTEDTTGKYIYSGATYYIPYYEIANQTSKLNIYTRSEAEYLATTTLTSETWLMKEFGYDRFVNSVKTGTKVLQVVEDGHEIEDQSVDKSKVTPYISTITVGEYVRRYPVYWQPYKEELRYKLSTDETSTFTESSEGTYIEIEPFEIDNIPMHGFYNEYPEYVTSKDKFVLGGENIFDIEDEEATKYVTTISVEDADIEVGSIDRVSGEALPDTDKSRASKYYPIGYSNPSEVTTKTELRYSLTNDQEYWCQIFEYRYSSLTKEYYFVRSYRLDYGDIFTIKEDTTHIRVCSGDKGTTGMTGLLMRLVTDDSANKYANQGAKYSTYNNAYKTGYYYFFDNEDRSMFCKLVGDSTNCQGYERYQFSGTILSQVSEMSDAIAGTVSKIEQTAASITSTVSNLSKDLNSKIEQLASGVTITTDADNSLLSAQLKITADSLTSVVTSGVSILEGGYFGDGAFSPTENYNFDRIIPYITPSYHFSLNLATSATEESSVKNTTVADAYSDAKNPYLYFDPKIVYKSDADGLFLRDTNITGEYYNPYSTYRQATQAEGGFKVIADKDTPASGEIQISKVFEDLPYIEINNYVKVVEIKRYNLINKGSFSRCTQSTTGALLVVSENPTGSQILQSEVTPFIASIEAGEYVINCDRYDSNSNGRMIFKYYTHFTGSIGSKHSGINGSKLIISSGSPTNEEILYSDVYGHTESGYTPAVGDYVQAEYYDPYSIVGVSRYSIYQTYCKVTGYSNGVYSYARYADLGRLITSKIRQYADSILLEVGDEAAERAAINITSSGITIDYENFKTEVNNKIAINKNSIESTMSGAFTVYAVAHSASFGVDLYNSIPEWDCDAGTLTAKGSPKTYNTATEFINDTDNTKFMYTIMTEDLTPVSGIVTSELMIKCDNISGNVYRPTGETNKYYLVTAAERYMRNPDYEKTVEGSEEYIQNDAGPYYRIYNSATAKYVYYAGEWYNPTVAFKKYYVNNGSAVCNIYIRSSERAKSDIVQTLEKYSVTLDNGAFSASLMMQLLNNESVIGLSADKIQLNGSVIATTDGTKAVRIDSGNIFSAVKTGTTSEGATIWSEIDDANWYAKADGEFMAREGLLGLTSVPVAANTTSVRTHNGDIYNSTYDGTAWSDIDDANWYAKADGSFKVSEGYISGWTIIGNKLYAKSKQVLSTTTSVEREISFDVPSTDNDQVLHTTTTDKTTNYFDYTNCVNYGYIGDDYEIAYEGTDAHCCLLTTTSGGVSTGGHIQLSYGTLTYNLKSKNKFRVKLHIKHSGTTTTDSTLNIIFKNDLGNKETKSCTASYQSGSKPWCTYEITSDLSDVSDILIECASGQSIYVVAYTEAALSDFSTVVIVPVNSNINFNINYNGDANFNNLTTKSIESKLVTTDNINIGTNGAYIKSRNTESVLTPFTIKIVSFTEQIVSRTQSYFNLVLHIENSSGTQVTSLEKIPFTIIVGYMTDSGGSRYNEIIINGSYPSNTYQNMIYSISVTNPSTYTMLTKDTIEFTVPENGIHYSPTILSYGIDIGGTGTTNRHIGSWQSAVAETIDSARAYKDNITYIDDRYVEMLLKLKPRSYTLVSESSGIRHTGFVLDEMKDAMDSCHIEPKELSAYSANADGLGGIKYCEILPIAIKEIQNLRKEIDELKKEIDQLKAEKDT